MQMCYHNTIGDYKEISKATLYAHTAKLQANDDDDDDDDDVMR